MNARYWPCSGVYPSVVVVPVGLRGTARSLRVDMHGTIDESAGEGPSEGARLGPVPVPDEAEDIVCEGGHAFEAAVAEHTALKNAEPDLDLVDP